MCLHTYDCLTVNYRQFIEHFKAIRILAHSNQSLVNVTIINHLGNGFHGWILNQLNTLTNVN